MKQIGTEDGFGLVGYYVDPFTEMQDYVLPIHYIPTKVDINAEWEIAEAFGLIVDWFGHIWENRN